MLCKTILLKRIKAKNLMYKVSHIYTELTLNLLYSMVTNKPQPHSCHL